MDAKDFAFNDGADAEVVEHLSTVFPRISIAVFTNCFIVEPVHCGDLSGFVVASQQCDVGRVLQFQAQKQLESFNRIETSINEVTHEHISG